MEIPSYLQTLYRFFKPIRTQLRWQHRCVMCAEPSEARICSNCETYWPLQTHCCQSCSLPLIYHSLLCGDCLKQPPAFDSSYAPYLYASPLSNLILTFKNQRDLATGTALCDYWQYRLKHHYQIQHLALPDYLAPVPTHWRRQWKRGFSHTHFCAEQLSHYFSIPLLKNTRMNHYTHTQKSLSRKQRLAILSSAFVVDTTLKGHSVAIVDDVMTTGATSNAFAKALKTAGAGNVFVWALSRTPK